MSVTDAEREFYESVLADTSGKSINDLRYAYFLAALDGGLPGGGGGGGTAAWGAIGGNLANQTDLQSALNAKAPLSSPAFTGNPTAPTPATGDDDTSVATTAFVKAQGYVPKSLVDAKGDLIVATGNDTPARLPVGSNGQVLTADSGESAGVKWATPSGGGGGLPLGNAMQDKLYSAGVSTSSGGGAPPVDIIHLTPVFLAAGFPIKRLLIGVQTAATGSQSFDVGIYDMNGDLLTSGTGSTGTSTGNKEVNLASLVTLDPGMYWFALKIREAAADSTLRMNAALDAQDAYISRGNGWDAVTSAVRRMYVNHAGTGALPSSIASLTLTEGGASVGFGWRVA